MSRALALALVSSLVLLAGCFREKYDKTNDAPLVRGGPAGDVLIDLAAPPAHKQITNVLVVPVKITNTRSRAIVVHPDRCRVECWDGTRSAPNYRGRSYRIRPRDDMSLKLVFGDDHGELNGSSFRIYFWIEDERTGFVEDLAPLTLQGTESFATAPRPLTKKKGTTAEQEFPPPEKFAPGNAARARGSVHLCAFCGEPREGAESCRSCSND